MIILNYFPNVAFISFFEILLTKVGMLFFTYNNLCKQVYDRDGGGGGEQLQSKSNTWALKSLNKEELQDSE